MSQTFGLMAMVSVGIRHDLKCFDLCINMLNDNTPPCQPSVVLLLPFCQLMLLARFLRYPAILMKLFYSKISKVGLYPDGWVNRVSDGFFVYPEIMHTAFPLPDIYDFPCLPVYYHLRLYRMALFLAGIPLFLFF